MIALALTAAVAFGQLPILQPRLACQTRPTAAAAGAGALMRPQDWRAARPRKLGDLPKANLEIAVDRRVGGCPAPVIVRYDVEGDGRAAGR